MTAASFSELPPITSTELRTRNPIQIALWTITQIHYRSRLNHSKSVFRLPVLVIQLRHEIPIILEILVFPNSLKFRHWRLRQRDCIGNGRCRVAGVYSHLALISSEDRDKNRACSAFRSANARFSSVIQFGANGWLPLLQ